MIAPVAHAGTDVTMLLLLALGAGGVATGRLRGKGFPELSARVAWLLAAAAVALGAVAVLVLFHVGSPTPARTGG
jgi:hypothetical protein